MMCVYNYSLCATHTDPKNVDPKDILLRRLAQLQRPRAKVSVHVRMSRTITRPTFSSANEGLEVSMAGGLLGVPEGVLASRRCKMASMA